jgi:hypothetical protein
MRRRSISITDDTWVRIKLHAVAANRTPSQIVEEACRRLIEERYGPQYPGAQGIALGGGKDKP